MAETETTTHAPLPAADPAAEARNQTEVFAVLGADPEVLAYAMAKYSRSALSMKDSLREISSQRAEQFLNTFYFQYGHRSIADLAHVAFAIERLSLAAAIVLVDEQRWDGQERSTRYQNFSKSGWYLPEFGDADQSRQLYKETIGALFREYHATAESMFVFLREKTPRPEEMKQDAFERTLRARAFDVARYLLPLATNTSLGQIVNARTLEGQISRLLSHPAAEIRELGAKLKEAAAGAAWNVQHEPCAALQAEIARLDPALGAKTADLLLREMKTSPTLVKYAAPNNYAIDTRRDLAEAAAALMKKEPIAVAPVVDLVEPTESLEVELATTLLYGVCHYPYRQVRERVAALTAAQQEEIVDMGLRRRGRHDELLREFSSGQSLRFDILMDIGGFRDMHRHRKCTQILQPFTSAHGFETPDSVTEAGLRRPFEAAMSGAHAAYAKIAHSEAPEAAQAATYVLPLGTRNRALFKMDFAEAVYIAELRSTPQGHFSYRRVAWEMYQAVAQQHPTLAKYFRIEDIHAPVDLLKR
ncbi:MAG TPA: FAD-dependent thymidylate synthase [Acidisarcina sp.]|nr:FAD-dependent thymidylate synthase [Acidisarcina sp.]